MNAPLQLIFASGQRLDLGKLARNRRGKVHSVDVCLRGSRCRRLESRLRGVFDEQRGRAKSIAVAEYARFGKDEVDDLIERILERLEVDGFSVDVVDELTPAIRAAFREAGLSALAEVNVDESSAIVGQVDALASAYAATHGADLVTRISETTRGDIRELVVNAVDEGWSTDRLATAIEDALAFSESRSEMIARTEMAFAHVGGNIAGYRASGVVERKRWIVAQDNVCPICDALDGAEVDLDESFDFDGEPVDGPPGHPNCRCDVIGVVAEPEDQGD